MKRPFIFLAAGLVALAAVACGLPDDIVGNAPTATTGPNITPTATEGPPTPGPQDGSQTPTPTATPIPVKHADVEEALLAAQDRWFETGYANYDFTFRWMCFCPPEYGKYARVSVRNGQATSVTDAETGEPHPMEIEEFRTIDGLFSYIREELDESTEKIEIEFDETTGAPLSARFDRIVQAIDDEIAFEVKDLEKADVHTGTQEELDSARAAWESVGIANYGFTFEWICFCALEYVEPVRIEVNDGEIVAVTKADGDAIPQDDWGWYETVDGLFDLLQDAIDRDAALIQAEYKVCDPMPEYGSAGGAPTAPDNCSGYPANVSIDYDYRLADDERGFQVSDFESTFEPVGG